MAGGHFKNNSNLLGRNREIDELEKKAINISAEINELKNRLEEIETAQALWKMTRQQIRLSSQMLILPLLLQK